MEPTDEGNHATNPPSEDEIHHHCKRQSKCIAISPWGVLSQERFSYPVQLPRARPSEVCNSWLPLTCTLAVRGSFWFYEIKSVGESSLVNKNYRCGRKGSYLLLSILVTAPIETPMEPFFIFCFFLFFWIVPLNDSFFVCSSIFPMRFFLKIGGNHYDQSFLRKVLERFRSKERRKKLWRLERSGRMDIWTDAATIQECDVFPNTCKMRTDSCEWTMGNRIYPIIQRSELLDPSDWKFKWNYLFWWEKNKWTAPLEQSSAGVVGLLRWKKIESKAYFCGMIIWLKIYLLKNSVDLFE